MIRQAVPGDEARIDAFLAPHSASSMFLRSNLAAFGLGPKLPDDPRASRFWIVERGDIEAVFARSNAGFLLGQAPDNRAEDWLAFRQQIIGQNVAGITGKTDQVEQAIKLLGLETAAFSLRRAEPHYHLDLRDLILPEGAGELRPADSGDYDLLVEWIVDYDTGALGAPDTAETRARAQASAKAYLNSPHHRILDVAGRPVAKTAFNAVLPDMVQIGGVYTPPAERSKGYARQAVALHLDEVRRQTVHTAILFASGAPACRAYEAIGFQRIGSYMLGILDLPVTIRPAS